MLKMLKLIFEKVLKTGEMLKMLNLVSQNMLKTGEMLKMSGEMLKMLKMLKFFGGTSGYQL